MRKRIVLRAKLIAAHTLICLNLIALSACGEPAPSIPSKIAQRTGETAIDAVRRFMERHRDVRFKLLDDYEAYLGDYISKQEVPTARFNLVTEYYRATITNGKSEAIVDAFMSSSAGAYLSDQDKEFIERRSKEIRAELEKRESAIEDQASKKLAQMKKNMDVSQLRHMFHNMPIIVDAIADTGDGELDQYARMLKQKMIEKEIPNEITQAFFQRSPNYSYDEIKNEEATFKKFVGAVFAAADEVDRIVRTKRKFKFLAPSNPYTLFLSTEASYGLDGFVNVKLKEEGLYSALGESRLIAFRKRLRAALAKIENM
jgi:hypothetical protein